MRIRPAGVLVIFPLLLSVFLVIGLACVFAASSAETQQQDQLAHCPEPGKWAISVWRGPNNSPIEEALATCNGVMVSAAYWLDPHDQNWLRYMRGRPDISNLAMLSDAQGILALGSPATTATASPTGTPSYSPTPVCALEVPSYYAAAGWMGDIDKITLDDAYTGVVHPPASSSIRVSYQPGNLGWAGIYFLRTDAQHPQGDWGDEPGYDLSGATQLTFWARGEQGGERVEFKVGGVDSPGKPYQDTLEKSLGVVTLSQEWQRFSIDLSGLDPSNVIGAFAWVASRANNASGLTFYLSEIVYEGVCTPERAG